KQQQHGAALAQSNVAEGETEQSEHDNVFHRDARDKTVPGPRPTWFGFGNASDRHSANLRRPVVSSPGERFALPPIIRAPPHMGQSALRRIANDAMALNPPPLFRYRRDTGFAVRDGVPFFRQELPGPGFNWAAAISSTAPLDQIRRFGDTFF